MFYRYLNIIRNISIIFYVKSGTIKLIPCFTIKEE